MLSNKKFFKLSFDISRGFTLIELLIVIAIIGILTSITLYTLAMARLKAKDVVIQTEIASSIFEAEIYYNAGASYEGLCDEPEYTAGGSIRQSIDSHGGSFVCGDGVGGFCISSTLNLGSSFCIDPIGEIEEGFVCSGPNDTECD